MFPMTPQTIMHRYGGQIVKVHCASHHEARPEGGRSRDYWFFICDVKWRDGTASERTEVEPFKLYCDDPPNNAEMSQLLKALDEYLREHGSWFREGPHQGWYAHRNKGP